MRLSPGSVFAGYQIERMLGRGGMGEVYLAQHPRLVKTVALKVLNDGLARDAGARKGFEREAAVAAKLEHPNIVAVFDRSGPEDENLWLSMAFINGPDAATLLARNGGALDPVRAVRLVEDAARGLDHAHRMGVIHRDVKPANILVAPDPDTGERGIVGDFGIARSAEDTATMSAIALSFGYSPPERFRGETIDQRADVYSLGVTLYQLLTGALPFPYQDQAAVMLAHLQEPPPAPHERRPGLPPRLSDVIRTALAKNPAERYSSCGEFARAAAEALAVGQAPTVFNHRPAQFAAAPVPAPPTYAPALAATPPTSSAGPGVSRRALLWGGAVAGVTTIAIGGVLLTRGGSEEQSGNVLRGHDGPVDAVAFNADGTVMATADRKSVFLWDARTRARIGDPLTGHQDTVKSLLFTPDNKTLILATEDGQIRFWEVGSGRPLGKPLTAHRMLLSAVVISPDGSTLASSGWNEPIKFWAVGDRRSLGDSSAFSNDKLGIIYDLAYSPDGNSVASASAAGVNPSNSDTALGTVRLWDAVGRKQGAVLLKNEAPRPDQTNDAVAVAFSRDGALLAGSTYDATIRIWDARGFQQIAELRGQEGMGGPVVFSPDGKTLASLVPGRNTIWLWDVASGRKSRELTGHSRSPDAIAFSPDGGTLLSGGYEGTVRLWDMR